MKEIFEFLIQTKDAEEVGLPLSLGRPNGNWITVRATPGDKVFELLRECENAWKRSGKIGSFAPSSKDIQRLYTSDEIVAAQLFRMVPIPIDSEAASDQLVYDVSGTCRFCGAGRIQVSDLLIDCTRLPRPRSIVHTIGKEWLFRAELAQELMNQDFTGFKFRPVIHRRNRKDMAIDLKKYATGRIILALAQSRGRLPPTGLEVEFPDLWPALMAEHRAAICSAESRSHLSNKFSQQWLQLEVTSTPVHMSEPTKFGTSCFDREAVGPRRRCPLGHTGGAALLSEVWVEGSQWDGSDMFCTSNLYGFQSGYFVPEPALLISPRLHNFLERRKIKGSKFEVAHFV